MQTYLDNKENNRKQPQSVKMIVMTRGISIGKPLNQFLDRLLLKSELQEMPKLILNKQVSLVYLKIHILHRYKDSQATHTHHYPTNNQLDKASLEFLHHNSILDYQDQIVFNSQYI